MEGSSSSKGKQQQQQGGGGKPARPHWRHRDPTATAVYVVHPTQFRDVVQQLTGAPPSPATAARAQDGSGNGGAATASAAASTNATARQQHGGDTSSNQRTLGQMHQECMAWVNSDEHDC